MQRTIFTAELEIKSQVPVGLFNEAAQDATIMYKKRPACKLLFFFTGLRTMGLIIIGCSQYSNEYKTTALSASTKGQRRLQLKVDVNPNAKSHKNENMLMQFLYLQFSVK